MLSLRELERVKRVLEDAWSGVRVERWVQPDPTSIAVTLYEREHGKRHLLLSVAPEVARLSAPASLPRAPANPPAFSSWLRAHLSRARLVGVRIVDGDRQLALEWEGAEGRFDLLLSLFGRRSNLYVLDAEGRLVLSLRPLADTRPELAAGEPWASPGSGLARAGEDRFEDVPDAELLRAIEAHYAEQQSERGAAELARRVLQAVRKERKTAERRLARVESELAEADQASTLQRHGELLKSALGRIAPGDAEVSVDDYETGEPVVIPLDPKKSPKQNLDATFKRYQKLLRRLTKAGGQLDAARERAEELAALEERCQALVGEAAEEARSELEALAERPDLRGHIARAPAGRAGPSTPAEEKSRLPAVLRDLPARLVPRRYRSRDDLEIWVGRSDEGNDYLTTRLARGNDLFFHLDGAPGSHVILRTEGRTDPPHESILDACELAVRFSKQKNAGRADVHVAPIKQVKKPKGAKPGLVWVTGGRSVHLRREEGRLERLLASRIDP